MTFSTWKPMRAVARDRHVAQRDALAPRAFGGHQRVAVDVHGALALRAVRGHHRVLPVGGEEDHAGRGSRRPSAATFGSAALSTA